MYVLSSYKIIHAVLRAACKGEEVEEVGAVSSNILAGLRNLKTYALLSACVRMTRHKETHQSRPAPAQENTSPPERTRAVCGGGLPTRVM